MVFVVGVSPRASYDISITINHDDPDGALTGTVPSGTSISAQQSNGNFRVSTRQDALELADKTATFTLTGVRVSGSNNPDAAALGSTTSTSVTVQNNDFKPGAPGNLQAVPGDAVIDLTWNTGSAGQLNGASTPITGYEYRQSTDGGNNWNPDWSAISGSDASTVSHTVTGLRNDTAYTFQVRAVNAVGEGAAAEDTAGSFSTLVTGSKWMPSKLRLYTGYPGWHLNWLQPDKAPQAWENDTPGWKALYNNGFDRYEVQYRWRKYSKPWSSWANIPLTNNPPTFSSPTGDQPNALELTEWSWVRLDLPDPKWRCHQHRWGVRAVYDNPPRHSEWKVARYNGPKCD